MKKHEVFKKYLIRCIGALCILCSVATLFFPAWIQVDGIRRKEFRELQDSFTTILTDEEALLLRNLDTYKEDLKDNDLPYKKTDIKNWFRDIQVILKDGLNDRISLKELTVLIWKAPGLLKDVENLAQTDHVLQNAVSFAVSCFYPSSEYTSRSISRFEKFLVDGIEDAADYFGPIRLGCYCAIVLSVLLALFSVFAAVGHVCNKCRWGKYVLLGISVILTAGAFVGLPMLSELLQELCEGVPYLEDLELRANLIPILSVVLLLVPVALDIVTKALQKKALAAQPVQNFLDPTAE